MMQVNIREAIDKLPSLIQKALMGEEIILFDEQAFVHLVPVAPTALLRPIGLHRTNVSEEEINESLTPLGAADAQLWYQHLSSETI